MPNSGQGDAHRPQPSKACLSAADAAGFAEKWTPLVDAAMATDAGDGPLARQFRFDERELAAVPGFGVDPVGDQAAEAVPGLLHKYAGRVLVVATGACAVHCRYCFRRHFPYADHRVDDDAIARIVDYIRADPTIREVILSGGDPLVLSIRRLKALISALADVEHLTRLRIHSRVPTVMPERLDAAMVDVLTGHRMQVVMVLHVNHADELIDAVRAPLRRLRDRQVLLLNQSVLLAGVNDSVEALSTLSEHLFDMGVLPYYLHTLDRVGGAAHFLVPEERGKRLIAEVRGRLPGFLVPRFVVEEAGGRSKTPIE